MGFIEKRSGGYRARYRDPLGHLRSKTFTRKADAERSAGRWRSTWSGATGSTRGAPRCRHPAQLVGRITHFRKRRDSVPFRT